MAAGNNFYIVPLEIEAEKEWEKDKDTREILYL